MRGAMDGFWFGVTYTFVCPNCQKMNVEKAGINSATDDPDKLNQKINQQLLSCQRCKTVLPNGTQVAVDVAPGTNESLRKQGFPLPPDK